MAINLKKGDQKELVHSKVTIGLGWKSKEKSLFGKMASKITRAEDEDFDLDCMVFMLNSDKKLPKEKCFIYHRNLKSECGGVIHKGDDKVGSNVGDAEQVVIDTSKLPIDIEELLFVVEIYEAEDRKQNFGQVRDSYIRIFDSENGAEICRYNLDENFSIESTIIFGRLIKKCGKWSFDAIGDSSEPLASLVEVYL